MSDIVYNVLTVALTVLSTVFVFVAAIMLGAKSSLLYDLSLDALRKGNGIWSARKGVKRTGVFDGIIRVLDMLYSALTIVIVAPILLTTIMCLKALNATDIFRKNEIVGKNGNCVKIYRINTVEEKGNNSVLARYKRFLHNVSFDELPVLFSVLKGDLSLFGLTRIPYSKKEILDTVYPELLAQYSQYRPGIVSIFTFETILNKTKQCQNELMHDIEFANDVFLRSRSMGLIVKMIAATIVSVVRV